MNRREFMVAASGVTGGAAFVTAATPVAAQEDDEAGDDPGGDTEENGATENGDENDENGGNGDDGSGNGAADNGNGDEEEAGATEHVEVGDNYFEPEELVVEPGTTVVWEWVGDIGHDVTPTGDPPVEWEGHPQLIDSGTHEETFEEEGVYEYTCTPHPDMSGSVTVDPDADQIAAGGDVDIHDLGVPILKHYVGIATFFAIFVSLVFTFYLLKYGESANTSSPGRK